jgi:hypothetical protein
LTARIVRQPPLTVLDQFGRRQGIREHPRGEFEADAMLA